MLLNWYTCSFKINLSEMDLKFGDVDGPKYMLVSHFLENIFRPECKQEKKQTKKIFFLIGPLNRVKGNELRS